jgi:hypothetical protein
MEKCLVAKKRNYRAERRSATVFADEAMDGRRLPRIDWLHMWGVIFEARLKQIRRRTGSAGEKP